MKFENLVRLTIFSTSSSAEPRRTTWRIFGTLSPMPFERQSSLPFNALPDWDQCRKNPGILFYQTCQRFMDIDLKWDMPYSLRLYDWVVTHRWELIRNFVTHVIITLKQNKTDSDFNISMDKSKSQTRSGIMNTQWRPLVHKPIPSRRFDDGKRAAQIVPSNASTARDSNFPQIKSAPPNNRTLTNITTIRMFIMTPLPRNNPSKKVAKYIADNKLTAPMWDWKPFFLGFPEEVKEVIFSQFEFQLPSKAQTKNDLHHATELLRKRVSLDDPHPMNTLAATSCAMRVSIEAYCRHLRESKGQTGCSHLQCSSIPPIQAAKYVLSSTAF